MKICLQSAVYNSVPKLSHRLRFILSHEKVIIDRTVISFSARKFEVFESNYKTRNAFYTHSSTNTTIHVFFFHGDLYACFSNCKYKFSTLPKQRPLLFLFQAVYFEINKRFKIELLDFIEARQSKLS